MNAAANKRPDTAECDAARNSLCDICPPGTTVYVIHRGSTRSGTNYLDFYVIPCASPRRVTDLVAKTLRYRQTDRGWLTVKGWGADCAWHVIHNLSYALHGMIGKGRGLDPSAPCDVADAENYRAGHSLRKVWL
jgi:hypothetical protein